jgi:hypothetical protein
MTEAAILEKIFDKYKFSAPVPATARERLVESRERVFRSALKELGVYSVWYAVILSVFFKLRNIGIKSSILAAKAVTIVGSIVVAGIIVSGTYAAYKYFYFGSAPVEENQKNNTEKIINSSESIPPEDAIQKPDIKQTQIKSIGPLSEVQLYNGRIYRGVILSRGITYIINTSDGQITIPAKQIRMIKRVK